MAPTDLPLFPPPDDGYGQCTTFGRRRQQDYSEKALASDVYVRGCDITRLNCQLAGYSPTSVDRGTSGNPRQWHDPSYVHKLFTSLTLVCISEGQSTASAGSLTLVPENQASLSTKVAQICVLTLFLKDYTRVLCSETGSIPSHLARRTNTP